MKYIIKRSIAVLFISILSTTLTGAYQTPQALYTAIKTVNKDYTIKKRIIKKSIKKIKLNENGRFKADSHYIEHWLNKRSKKYDFKIPYECPICLENKEKLFKLRCNHEFCKLCLVQQYVIKNYVEYTHAKCGLCRSWFGKSVCNALKKHSQYKRLYILHEGKRLHKEAELIAQQIEDDEHLAREIQARYDDEFSDSDFSEEE